MSAMCVQTRVQEVAIVRDHDQRALVAEQELAQPVNRVEVEVVRRLVEQQRFRAGRTAPARAARGLSGRPAAPPSSDRAAHRECRGPAAGSPRRSRPCSRPRRRRSPSSSPRRMPSASVMSDFAYRRSRSSSADQSRALPMITVSSTRILVERELVLPQDAELARPGHGAALRRQLAGEQLHERRLARAVRPGQPVAAARPRTSSSRRRRAPSTRTAWTHPELKSSRAPVP